MLLILLAFPADVFMGKLSDVRGWGKGRPGGDGPRDPQETWTEGRGSCSWYSVAALGVTRRIGSGLTERMWTSLR